MRAYVLVVLMILALMSGYVALLPHAGAPGTNASLTGAGPF